MSNNKDKLKNVKPEEISSYYGYDLEKEKKKK